MSDDFERARSPPRTAVTTRSWTSPPVQWARPAGAWDPGEEGGREVAIDYGFH